MKHMPDEVFMAPDLTKEEETKIKGKTAIHINMLFNLSVFIILLIRKRKRRF